MALLWTHPSNAETTNGDSGAAPIATGYRGRAGLPRQRATESGDIFPNMGRIAFDANVTALTGTTPGIQFFIDTHWGDGQWRLVYSSAVITATGPIGPVKLGSGFTQAIMGQAFRVRWVLTGTTPSVTFVANVNSA